MDRPISRLFKLLCLAILLKAAALSAQEDLVRVSVRPDKEEWDWQPYAEQLAGRLATAIDSRERGFPAARIHPGQPDHCARIPFQDRHPGQAQTLRPSFAQESLPGLSDPENQAFVFDKIHRPTGYR